MRHIRIAVRNVSEAVWGGARAPGAPPGSAPGSSVSEAFWPGANSTQAIGLTYIGADINWYLIIKYFVSLSLFNCAKHGKQLVNSKESLVCSWEFAEKRAGKMKKLLEKRGKFDRKSGNHANVVKV